MPKRHNPLLPQSGLTNISWDQQHQRWYVSFRGLKDGVKKRLTKFFSWKRHLKSGASVEEAQQRSLEEAKEFREKLIAEGTLKRSGHSKLGSDIDPRCLRILL